MSTRNILAAAFVMAGVSATNAQEDAAPLNVPTAPIATKGAKCQKDNYATFKNGVCSFSGKRGHENYEQRNGIRTEVEAYWQIGAPIYSAPVRIADVPAINPEPYKMGCTNPFYQATTKGSGICNYSGPAAAQDGFRDGTDVCVTTGYRKSAGMPITVCIQQIN